MVQRDGTAVLENVSLQGGELPGCLGRLQNPGKHCSTCSVWTGSALTLSLVADFDVVLRMSSRGSGHALEAGWFLLQLSAQQQDSELQRTAINKFVELPFQSGWDNGHGGLFYFLDVDGHCPTQVKQSSGPMTVFHSGR